MGQWSCFFPCSAREGEGGGGRKCEKREEEAQEEEGEEEEKDKEDKEERFTTTMQSSTTLQYSFTRKLRQFFSNAEGEEKREQE